MEVSEFLEKTEFKVVKEGDSEGVVLDFNNGEYVVAMEFAGPSLGEYSLYPKDMREMGLRLTALKTMIVELVTHIKESRGENPWQS